MSDTAAILEELKRREPIFHRPEFGTTRADFEKMIVDDFWEIGASGRRYDRAFVLDELERRHASPVQEDFSVEHCACRQLSEHVYLFTYVLWQGSRKTRRATIWSRADGTWRAMYHQGTLDRNGLTSD